MKFKEYKSIEDLKNKSNAELKELSDNIRSLIYDQIINDEGHLGSNLSITELTISLLKNFQTDNVRYLFDTGYQAYGYRMLTDKRDFLENIHKPNGYSIFQEISEGDDYSGGHTSISAAWASGYNKVDKEKLTIEIIGDGSLATSIGLGAMANFAKTNNKGLFILNDNKQGIGMNEFNYLDWEKISTGMNYDYYEVIDGHDFDQLQSAFDFFKKAKKNVFIKVNTIKAYGLKESDNEESLHYVMPKINKPKGKINPINWMVNNYFSKIIKENKDVVVYFAGMNYAFGFNELKKQYPDQIFDAGISEEISIIEAAAAANLGKDVYFIVSSSFSQRVYDQIVHDIMRNNVNMKIFITSTGVTTIGDSHHGIYDLNMYNGFENIHIYQPTNISELQYLIEDKTYEGPTVIRMEPMLSESIRDNDVKLWKLIKTSENNDKVIITYSSFYDKLLDFIDKNNEKIDVVKAVSLNPIDEKLLKEVFGKYKYVYSYEPVFWKNNLSSSVRTKFPNQNIIDFAFKKPIIGKWDLKSIFEKNEMDLENVFKKINQYNK